MAFVPTYVPAPSRYFNSARLFSTSAWGRRDIHRLGHFRSIHVRRPLSLMSVNGKTRSSSEPKIEPPPPELSSSAEEDSSNLNEHPSASEFNPSPPQFKRFRPLIGAYWLVLIAYGFTVSGPLITDNLLQLATGHFFEVNQILATEFNIIGALGINYAMILNPGASRQRKWVPTSFFSTMGVFFGFFAVGPYLTVREYAPQVTKSEVEERGLFNRALESRWLALFTVAVNLGWYAYGFGLFYKGSELWHDFTFFSSLIEMARFIQTDKFVRIMSIDFATLSLFLWGPLTEDMRRRGWFKKDNGFESICTAISILMTPALGPSIYALFRPSLPDKIQVDGDE